MTYRATCTLSAPEQDTQQRQLFLVPVFRHLSREGGSFGARADRSWSEMNDAESSSSTVSELVSSMKTRG